jgi:formate dehydrogenase (NADP+) beta subunit
MTALAYGVWDGQVVDRRNADVPLPASLPALDGFDCFNKNNPIRAFLGDRGFLVFDPSVSLVDAFRRQMEMAAAQSCGKCTPCRIGAPMIRDALGAFARAQPGPLDLDGIVELARQMTDSSLCGLGRTCAVALLGAIAHFRPEIEAEIATARPLPEQPGMDYMTAPCIEACPSKINVPRYIDYVRDGKPAYSLGVILQKYPMAATCGRVCVRFCEMACRRALVDEAVGIKTLKRYVADHQQGPDALRFTRDLIARTLPPEMRVAVVGAGPAGVSCAYHLLLHGYHVDILESLDEAGGMAAIGIPSYRLPKDVLHSETDIITALGGRFLFNQSMGRDFGIDDLFARGYRAVFLALGCQQGSLMGVPGEDRAAIGYETGISFLLKVHDHIAGTRLTPLSGEVAVVGGGNVAMDCARSALRMGAERVHLIYRRTRADMPADPTEVEAADAEGVVFHPLENPARVVIEDGRVTGIDLVSMRQTELDAKGRRGVEPIPGSERFMPFSTVIAAIGQQVQSGAIRPEDGLRLTRWGWVEVDPFDLASSRPGVFAGGDCASGPSTLIHAMANGLQAARSIDDWIQLGHTSFFPRTRMRALLHTHKLLAADFSELPVRLEYRVHHPELDPEVRRTMFEEVEATIGDAAAYREARRCLRCYRIYSVITAEPIPQGAA